MSGLYPSSGHKRLSLVIGSAVTALVVLASIAITTAIATTSSCANTSTLSNSGFEIDTSANLIVNAAGCIDWLTGGPGTVYRSGVVVKGDQPTGASDDSFGNGTSENDANPSITSGSIPPNKSDLKAFGAFTEATANAKFLHLFWSRVQNPSGTTNMDFELNQKFCDPSASPTNCANNGSGVTPKTPLRTAGDLLITYDLSNGGTVPSVSIRKWSGSAWGAATTITGGANPSALGSVNTGTLAASDTGGLGQQDPYTFGEATIAFTALFPAGTGCGAFGGAYLKSRSSDSFSSALKDFIAPVKVNVTNCPSILTSATASVTIGGSISDTATMSGATANATGTISFALYGPFDPATAASGDTCVAGTLVTTLGPVSLGTQNGSGDFVVSSGSYMPTAAGRYQWVASYTSGDTNNVSRSSACKDANEASVVNKATPSVSTQVKNNAGDGNINNNSHVGIGTTAYDTATLSNASANAGGAFQFYVEKGDATCTVDANTVNLGSKGLGTKSDTYTFPSTGTYYFWAVYSGDTNNATATSPCNSELVVVDPNQPTLTTQVKNSAGDGNIANNGHVAIGVAVYDTAVLGNASSPTANISFYVEKGDASCSIDANTTSLGSKALNAASNTYTFTAAGTYYFWAVYPGDANNSSATSDCSTEIVIVDKNRPTLATQVKKSDNSNIANNGHVPIGTAAFDTAQLSSAATPTGDISFYVEKGDSSCTTNGATSLGSKAIGTNSNTYTFATAGTYYFWAVYSGDDNNETATSSCTTEIVIVDKNSPTLTTQVKNNVGNGDIATNGHVVIGTVAYDTAQLNGASNATGNISFYVEKGDASCSIDANTTSLGSKALGTNSNTYTFATAGTYYFWAVYPGDDNNKDATSSCSTEVVIVDKNSPTLTTQVKNNAGNGDIANNGHVAIGTVAYDTAALHQESNATGSIQFYVEKGDASCTTNDATDLGSKAIGNNSNTFEFKTAGTYYFWAVYPGDDNNKDATSPCDSEIVIVDKNQPGATTAQTLLPNDAATVTGATANAGGSLTFELFNPSDATCTGAPAFNQTVTVSGNGVYPTSNTTFLAQSPGTWRWKVTYSGDNNNGGFTIACGEEQFTIVNSLSSQQQV